MLSDYRLTGALNGLDLIAAIARRHPAPAPAAALITGDLNPALMAEADACGVPMLLKPVDPLMLKAMLDA